MAKEDRPDIYACSVPQGSASYIARSAPATYDFCSDFLSPRCYQPNARAIGKTIDRTNTCPSRGSETILSDFLCQTVVIAVKKSVSKRGDDRTMLCLQCSEGSSIAVAM